MIKEKNRRIILFIAFIAAVLAIIIRCIYGLKSIIGFIDFEFYAALIFYYIIIFAILLILFFLTFFSEKNRKINLLILICIIELAQYLVGIKFSYMHFINYIDRITYISAIILSIFLIVNTKITKYQFDVIKLIIIGLFSIHYKRLIFDTIFTYDSKNFLLVIAFLFALVSMVLVVIQINPTIVSSKKPKNNFYISSIYNLVLILTYNNILFSFRESMMFLYIQLIFILVIISVQGVLSFYNKNIASYIFHLIGISLLTLYIIGTEMEVKRVIGSLIVLVIGICLDFVFIFKEKKNKVINQD